MWPLRNSLGDIELYLQRVFLVRDLELCHYQEVKTAALSGVEWKSVVAALEPISPERTSETP